MSLYLGLDPSLTHTGVVVVNNKLELIFSTVLLNKSDGVERLLLLEEALWNSIKVYVNDIVFCAIESGAYREVGRLFDLGEWSGVLKLLLFKNGKEFITVAPMQLKKYISGYGRNRGKSTVMLDVYKYYGVEIRDDNVADAYVLAIIARDFYFMLKNAKRVAKLPKYQKEVLRQLSKTVKKISVL